MLKLARRFNFQMKIVTAVEGFFSDFEWCVRWNTSTRDQAQKRRYPIPKWIQKWERASLYIDWVSGYIKQIEEMTFQSQYLVTFFFSLTHSMCWRREMVFPVEKRIFLLILRRRAFIFVGCTYNRSPCWRLLACVYLTRRAQSIQVIALFFSLLSSAADAIVLTRLGDKL